MRRHIGAGIVALALVLALAPTAYGATEAGDDCVANATRANRTMIAWNSGSFSLNRVVGEPGEVITSWTVRVAPGQVPLPQRLETFRAVNEAPEEVRKEAESSLELVSEGLSTFQTRIPAKPYAQLGLYGPSGTFVCETGESVVTGSFEGSAASGETRQVSGSLGLRTPITVKVEKDVDNDGYGDETQDGCPQSAAYHGECPAPVAVRASATAKQKAILLQVKVSGEASVHAFGQVGWGYKANPNLKTAGSKPTRLIIGLNGGTKSLAAGGGATFRIPLRKATLRRLGRIDPSEVLKAKITALATDTIGRESARHLTVVLRGRRGT
jgi:hypothetical protein